ncbi:hypothetical protein VTK26DRAFT_5910 [Humicola hyalothermophila]
MALLNLCQPGLLLGLELETTHLLARAADAVAGGHQRAVRLALGRLGAHDSLARLDDARVQIRRVVVAVPKGPVQSAAGCAGNSGGCLCSCPCDLCRWTGGICHRRCRGWGTSAGCWRCCVSCWCRPRATCLGFRRGRVAWGALRRLGPEAARVRRGGRKEALWMYQRLTGFGRIKVERRWFGERTRPVSPQLARGWYLNTITSNHHGRRELAEP